MRRVHLQGRKNILKRLLVHGAAFNLSLILRKIMGVGKPRRLQGLCLQLLTLFVRLFSSLWLTSRASGQGLDHFALQSSIEGASAPADQHVLQ
jgi:hypothetical protein